MKQIFVVTSVLSIALVFYLSFQLAVYSGPFEGSSTITGTVDGISVCGDFLVEGDEECEPLAPITQSCTDFDFDTGSLTCDSSCSYNYSNCEYIPPTPIIPPFPNPFIPDDQEEPGPIRILLPFFLGIYDLDNNGDLNTVEYCSGLTYWLKKWRIRLINPAPEGDIARIAGAKDTCDLNFDKNCNLTDFSIFLHNR